MNVSCGVYCVFIVNGVLGIDACWVYSVCSVYEAFGLVAFVAFMGHWSWTLVAFLQCWQCLWGIGVGRLWRFTTFVAFMGLGVVHSALVWCLACVCFFLLNIGGCLWVWCIGAQASPSHEPLLSELGFQLGGPFGLAWGLMAGGRGFAGHGGVTLSRGWLCQRWKPWTSWAPSSTKRRSC